MATPDSLPSDLPRRFTVSGEAYEVRPSSISTFDPDLGIVTVDVRSGDPIRIRQRFMHELTHLVLLDAGLAEPLVEEWGPGGAEDFVELFSRRLNAVFAENGWLVEMRGGAVGAAVEEAVRAAEGVAGC